MSAFRKAQENAPNLDRLHYRLAQVYLQQGKITDSLAACENYLRYRSRRDWTPIT